MRSESLRTLALSVVLSMWGHAAAASDVDAVRAHLVARGASTVAEVARGFLFEGQATAHTAELARSGCVAFLALGRGDVRDVDLGIYTRAGQLIAEDVAIAPYAYARVCGARGLALHASATLYAGRGELRLLRVDDAPRELGRLPESVALAVSVGGTLEDLRGVGVAADEPTTESALLQEERAQLALGYAAVSLPMALEVRAGIARGELLLKAGSCVRVSATVPLSRGVALEIEAPNAARWATRTPGEDRAAVALCAPSTGVYDVRIQARALRGMALVRAFEHREVDPVRVRELGAASALAVAEVETIARARGFRLTSLGNAWVEGTSALAWPLQLDEPRCYALAAISEVGATAVDVRVTRADGTLIAHNEGRRGAPLVFFCVERATTARLIMRARGPDLRVGVWLGRGEEK